MWWEAVLVAVIGSVFLIRLTLLLRHRQAASAEMSAVIGQFAGQIAPAYRLRAAADPEDAALDRRG